VGEGRGTRLNDKEEEEDDNNNPTAPSLSSFSLLHLLHLRPHPHPHNIPLLLPTLFPFNGVCFLTLQTSFLLNNECRGGLNTRMANMAIILTFLLLFHHPLVLFLLILSFLLLPFPLLLLLLLHPLNLLLIKRNKNLLYTKRRCFVEFVGLMEERDREGM
jgi:hypothetical protein